MTQQTVKTRVTTPLQGVALIAGVLVLLIAASFIGSALNLMLRTAWCSAGVWLLTACMAVYVLRSRVMEYRYTVDGGRAYIERTYGKNYSRVLLNLPLSDILALGTEAEMRERYPQIAFVRRAWLKQSPLEKCAFVYRKDGKYEMAVLQADDAMKRALFDAEKRRASAREKWG